MNSISFKTLSACINNNQAKCICYIYSEEGYLKKSEVKYPNFISEKDLNIILEEKSFLGKKDQFVSYSEVQEEQLSYAIFFGAGSEKEEFRFQENLRNTIGSAIRFVEKNKISSLAIVLVDDGRFEKTKIYELISSTVVISSYEFNNYITDENRKAFSDYNVFICAEEESKEDYLRAIEIGKIIGSCVNNARYLGDETPSEMYPKIFIEKAEQLLKKHENIKYKILNKEELKKLGMGGILGVCRGSENDPYLFIAEYEPKIKPIKSIALVGKGVTFDTGGISIKPADNMEDMKNDMAGASIVLSAFDALVSLNSPYRITIACAMVENMPSGTAIKPGDILKFYNKKTAEIKNTDAEGRLILADALSYVSDVYKPDIMLDFATLTGACCYAVGPIFAAIMGKHDNIIQAVRSAGLESGDRCWELPLDDMYKAAVISDVADVRNTGISRYKAGTITAGWFLKAFVPDDIQWAHLDIASVSSHPVGKNYLRAVGATGFGVRLCVELLSKDKYIK